MRTLKTYMVSALTLGAIGATYLPTDALAGHKQGPGKGSGNQYVDVYVDAGRNARLERAIGTYLVEYNPYVNIVYSPYYADVTVSVNGYLSRPEIYARPYGHHKSGYASMNYNYKVKVQANGRVIYKDRIYGEVSQPLGKRYGYHNNSTKAGKALTAFSLFVDIASDGKFSHNYARFGKGYGNRYRPNFYQIERQLKREAIERVAHYVGHIRIPKKYLRY